MTTANIFYFKNTVIWKMFLAEHNSQGSANKTIVAAVDFCYWTYQRNNSKLFAKIKEPYNKENSKQQEACDA